MNKIYSAAQIQSLYQCASEMSISPSDLCERGAASFVRALDRLYRGDSMIYLFAGPTDCGAWTLEVARQLWEGGRQIRIYLVYHQGRISQLAETKRQELVNLGIAITEITSQLEFPEATQGSIIIDGLFGSELEQSLTGGFAHLVRRINASGAKIISLDLPSGLFAEDNEYNDSSAIVQADHTFVFEAPRLCMLLAENEPFVGHWEVLSLGLDEEVHGRIASNYYTPDERLLSQVLRHRKAFSSRADYGKALLVGGAEGRYGHLSLVARGALLAGCGEVEVRTQGAGLIPMQIAVPEVSCYDASRIFVRWDGYQGIAVGVGDYDTLSREDLVRICRDVRQPLLLDDHAVDLIAEDHELLSMLPKGSILLVSRGQRADLLNVGQVHSDYHCLGRALALAQQHDLTIVLKGTYTAICRSSQSVYFNTTGNAGLATRGVGHVLQGLILGFMAQGYESLTACILANYILGSAGDLYAARYSMESLTATQLLDQIPNVLNQLKAI